MSAATYTATYTETRHRAARIGTWGGVLRAELLRTRHSAVQWFPLVGLLLGVVSSGLATAVAGAPDVDIIVSWQGMYVTGMAMPLMALLAALAEGRERRARCGGTDLRPVSPRRVRLVRLLVLWAVSAVFHLANYGATWLFVVVGGGAGGGFSGSGVVVSTGALSWVASLGVLAVVSVLARYLTVVPVLVLAVIAQVSGTLAAESGSWLFYPPSWPIRLLLPVLGIHSNAVPLQPGEILGGPEPLGAATAAVLNLLLIVVGTALAVTVSGRRTWRLRLAGRRAGRAASVAPPTSPAPVPAAGALARPGTCRRPASPRFSDALAGVALALRGTLATPAVLAAAVLMLVVGVVYPPSYATQLWTFVLLPLGAGLLPVITWPVMAAAWRVSVLENHRSPGAYLVWQAAVVAVLTVVAAVAALLAGADVAPVLRSSALSVLVGTVLVLVATALCARVGTGAAVAATVLWTVVSLTLGGDVLADTVLWILAVPAWPLTALGAGRTGVALVLLVVLLVAGALGARREFRAVGRRG